MPNSRDVGVYFGVRGLEMSGKIPLEIEGDRVRSPLKLYKYTLGLQEEPPFEHQNASHLR